MRVTSTKPKGQRIFKSPVFEYMKGIKRRRPFFIEPLEDGWWFCLEKGQWESEYNNKGGMSSSYYALSYHGFNNAYSLKAVKRLITKWDVPKGTKFKASLPFVGYDFFLTK
jgi:hypothetical protein